MTTPRSGYEKLRMDLAMLLGRLALVAAHNEDREAKEVMEDAERKLWLLAEAQAVDG